MVIAQIAYVGSSNAILLTQQCEVRYQGKRYDCGSEIGYLVATLFMASKHPDVGAEFEALLQKIQSKP